MAAYRGACSGSEDGLPGLLFQGFRVPMAIESVIAIKTANDFRNLCWPIGKPPEKIAR